MKRRPTLKILAFVLAVIQLVTLVDTSAWAYSKPVLSAALQSWSPDQISIPENLGRIQTRNGGKSGKTLLLIEDAHAVSSAQKSIWKVLDQVRKRYGAFTLHLEGLNESSNLALEHSFPDRDWLRKKLEVDVEIQNISGGAAALIASDLHQPRAAESKDLYFKAVKLYQGALKMQAPVLNALKRAREIIARSKQKTYSAEALNWDRFVSEDSLEALPLILRLPASSLANRFPHLESVRRQVQVQEHLKRPAMIQYWQRCLGVLAKHATNSTERLALLALQKDVQTSRLSITQSAQRLEQIAPQGLLDKLSKLEKRFCLFALRSEREWNQIKTAELAAEYQEFLVQKISSHFTKSAQHLLLKQTLRIRLLEKLVRMELSFADWQSVKKMNLEKPDWQVFKDFYAVQFDREKQMQKHISASFRSNETVVFVSGGFHRQGLEEIAQKQGWNFIVITPNIDSLEGADRYAELMQGNVGWRAHMKIVDGQVDLQKAYWSYLLQAYAKDHPEQIYDLLLNWRKQLILRLADLKQLHQAVEVAAPLHGWLVDFMPELVKQKYHAEWLKHLQSSPMQAKTSALPSSMTQSPVLVPLSYAPAEIVFPTELNMLPNDTGKGPHQFDPKVRFATDYQLSKIRNMMNPGDLNQTQSDRQKGHKLFQEISDVSNLFEGRKYLDFIEALLIAPDFFNDSKQDTRAYGTSYYDFYEGQIRRGLSEAQLILESKTINFDQLKNAVRFLEMLAQADASVFLEFRDQAQKLLYAWPEKHLIVSKPVAEEVKKRLDLFLQKISHEKRDPKEKRLREVLLSPLIHSDTAGLLRSILWKKLLAAIESGKGDEAAEFFLVLARLLIPMEDGEQITSYNDFLSLPAGIIQLGDEIDFKKDLQSFLIRLEGEDEYALGYAAIRRYANDFDFLARLAFGEGEINVRFKLYAFGLLNDLRHQLSLQIDIKKDKTLLSALMLEADELVAEMGQNRSSEDLQFLFSQSFATENLKVLQIAVFLSMMQRKVARVDSESLIKIMSTIMSNGDILWGDENAYASQKIGNRFVAKMENFQVLFMVMAHEFGHLILAYQYQFKWDTFGLPGQAAHELGSDLVALAYAEKIGWVIKPYLELAKAEESFNLLKSGSIPNSEHILARMVIHNINTSITNLFGLFEDIGWNIRLEIFLAQVENFKLRTLCFSGLSFWVMLMTVLKDGLDIFSSNQSPAPDSESQPPSESPDAAGTQFRSEVRQSLINHPEIGPKIRAEIVGESDFFIKYYESRLENSNDYPGVKSWLYDDDKIALAVDEYAEDILKGGYYPLKRFEIKQYRKALRSKNPDYYSSEEVPFYLERREYFGLSNAPRSLRSQNPGLYDAALREGYAWNEEVWTRSEARIDLQFDEPPTFTRLGLLKTMIWRDPKTKEKRFLLQATEDPWIYKIYYINESKLQREIGEWRVDVKAASRDSAVKIRLSRKVTREDKQYVEQEIKSDFLAALGAVGFKVPMPELTMPPDYARFLGYAMSMGVSEKVINSIASHADESPLSEAIERVLEGEIPLQDRIELKYLVRVIRSTAKDSALISSAIKDDWIRARREAFGNEAHHLNAISEDGIAYDLWIPQKTKEEKTSVVVFFHGLTDSKEQPYFNALEKSAFDKGQAVLRIDLPGHGESSMTLGEDYQFEAFLNSVLKIIRENPELNADEIDVVGHSFGGLVALRALLHSEFSKHIKNAAVFSPPVNHVFMNGAFVNFRFYDQFRRMLKGDEGSLTAKEVLDVSKFGLTDAELDRISRFSGGVRIWAGTADHLVLPDIKHLEERVPQSVVWVKDNGHFFAGEAKNGADQQALDFLELFSKNRSEVRQELTPELVTGFNEFLQISPWAIGIILFIETGLITARIVGHKLGALEPKALKQIRSFFYFTNFGLLLTFFAPILSSAWASFLQNPKIYVGIAMSLSLLERFARIMAIVFYSDYSEDEESPFEQSMEARGLLHTMFGTRWGYNWLAAPVYEELFDRALLLFLIVAVFSLPAGFLFSPPLLMSFSTILKISAIGVVTTLFFVLTHVGQSWNAAVSRTISGATLFTAFILTGNILVPIAMHLIRNFQVLLTRYLNMKGMFQPDRRPTESFSFDDGDVDPVVVTLIWDFIFFAFMLGGLWAYFDSWNSRNWGDPHFVEKFGETAFSVGTIWALPYVVYQTVRALIVGGVAIQELWQAKSSGGEGRAKKNKSNHFPVRFEALTLMNFMKYWPEIEVIANSLTGDVWNETSFRLYLNWEEQDLVKGGLKGNPGLSHIGIDSEGKVASVAILSFKSDSSSKEVEVRRSYHVVREDAREKGLRTKSWLYTIEQIDKIKESLPEKKFVIGFNVDVSNGPMIKFATMTLKLDLPLPTSFGDHKYYSFKISPEAARDRLTAAAAGFKQSRSEARKTPDEKARQNTLEDILLGGVPAGAKNPRINAKPETDKPEKPKRVARKNQTEKLQPTLEEIEAARQRVIGAAQKKREDTDEKLAQGAPRQPHAEESPRQPLSGPQMKEILERLQLHPVEKGFVQQAWINAFRKETYDSHAREIFFYESLFTHSEALAGSPDQLVKTARAFDQAMKELNYPISGLQQFKFQRVNETAAEWRREIATRISPEQAANDDEIFLTIIVQNSEIARDLDAISKKNREPLDVNAIEAALEENDTSVLLKSLRRSPASGSAGEAMYEGVWRYKIDPMPHLYNTYQSLLFALGFDKPAQIVRDYVVEIGDGKKLTEKRLLNVQLDSDVTIKIRDLTEEEKEQREKYRLAAVERASNKRRPKKDSSSRSENRTAVFFGQDYRQEAWGKLGEQEEIHDVLIVGGGAAGAAIARDAALRGLKTILFEKDDFASGTSSRSTKIIHAGIRYLELAWEALWKKEWSWTRRWTEAKSNFMLVVGAARERKILSTIAPELVEPLDFFIPLYEDSERAPIKVFSGALLYSIISWLTGNGFSKFRPYSKRSAQKKFPELSADRLAGGLLYTDALTNDAALTRAMLYDARVHGADALPHVEVKNYEKKSDGKGEYFEVTIQNRLGDDRDVKNIRTRTLVNASGPWIDVFKKRNVAAQADSPKLVGLSRGIHLDITGDFIDQFPEALFLEKKIAGKKGKIFFVVPRESEGLHYLRIGTTDQNHYDPDVVYPSDEEAAELLDAFKSYFPNVQLDERNILSADAGIRPLAMSPTAPGNLNQASREHRIVKDEDEDGFIHIPGVKLTDSRRAGEQVVDALIKHHRHRFGRVSKKKSSRQLLTMPPSEPLRKVKSTSGAAPSDGDGQIIRWMDKKLNYAMLLTFSDLMFRHEGEKHLTTQSQRSFVLNEMASRLGWSDVRKAAELAAYEAERKKRMSAVGTYFLNSRSESRLRLEKEINIRVRPPAGPWNEEALDHYLHHLVVKQIRPTELQVNAWLDDKIPTDNDTVRMFFNFEGEEEFAHIHPQAELLDNAAKAVIAAKRQEGLVTVRFSKVGEETLTYEVLDNGVGLSDEAWKSYGINDGHIRMNGADFKGAGLGVHGVFKIALDEIPGTKIFVWSKQNGQTQGYEYFLQKGQIIRKKWNDYAEADTQKYSTGVRFEFDLNQKLEELSLSENEWNRVVEQFMKGGDDPLARSETRVELTPDKVKDGSISKLLSSEDSKWIWYENSKGIGQFAKVEGHSLSSKKDPRLTVRLYSDVGEPGLATKDFGSATLIRGLLGKITVVSIDDPELKAFLSLVKVRERINSIINDVIVKGFQYADVVSKLSPQNSSDLKAKVITPNLALWNVLLQMIKKMKEAVLLLADATQEPDAIQDALMTALSEMETFLSMFAADADAQKRKDWALDVIKRSEEDANLLALAYALIDEGGSEQLVKDTSAIFDKFKKLSEKLLREADSFKDVALSVNRSEESLIKPEERQLIDEELPKILNFLARPEEYVPGSQVPLKNQWKLFDIHGLNFEKGAKVLVMILGTWEEKVAAEAAPIIRNLQSHHDEVKVLTSGKYGNKPGVFFDVEGRRLPEAVHYKNILQAQGVTVDFVEPESTDTGAKISNSKKVIDQAGFKPDVIVVMQNALLQKRASATIVRQYLGIGEEREVGEAKKEFDAAGIRIISYAPYVPLVPERSDQEIVQLLDYALKEIKSLRSYPERNFTIPVEIPDAIIQVETGLTAILSSINQRIGQVQQQKQGRSEMRVWGGWQAEELKNLMELNPQLKTHIDDKKINVDNLVNGIMSLQDEELEKRDIVGRLANLFRASKSKVQRAEELNLVTLLNIPEKQLFHHEPLAMLFEPVQGQPPGVIPLPGPVSDSSIELLIDEILKVAKKNEKPISENEISKQNGTAMLKAAQVILPGFQSELLPADEIKSLGLNEFHLFVNEIAERVFLPAGVVFALTSGLDAAANPVYFLGKIKENSWRRVRQDFVGQPRYLAEMKIVIATEGGPSSHSGIPPHLRMSPSEDVLMRFSHVLGGYLFVDFDAAADDARNTFRQFSSVDLGSTPIVNGSLFGYVLELFKKMMVWNEEDYSAYFGIARKTAEELAKSIFDIAQTKLLKKHQADSSGGKSLSVLTSILYAVENAVLNPRTSILMQKINKVEVVASDGATAFLLNVTRELYVHLRGIMIEMQSYLDEARLLDSAKKPKAAKRLRDIAYAAFLDFILFASLASHDGPIRIDSWLRPDFSMGNSVDPFKSAAMQFFFSALQEILEPAKIKPQRFKDLFSYVNKPGEGHPAEQALELLKKTFESEFLTDDAIEVNLRSEMREVLEDMDKKLEEMNYTLSDLKTFKSAVMEAVEEGRMIDTSEQKEYLELILAASVRLFILGQTEEEVFVKEVAEVLKNVGRTVDVTRILNDVSRIKEIYNPFVQLDQGFVREDMSSLLRNPNLRQVVAEKIGERSRGGKLLSVGVGIGKLEKDLIRSYSVQVTGTDIVTGFLEIIRRDMDPQSQITPVAAHGELLPFKNQSYETVIYPESIGHLNLKAAVQEASRVLKPGGNIFIMTYPHENEVAEEFEYTQFKEDEIRAGLTDSGFNEIEFERINYKKGYWLISATKKNGAEETGWFSFDAKKKELVTKSERGHFEVEENNSLRRSEARAPLDINKTVDYILSRFSHDENLKLLPTQNEIAKNLNLSQTNVSLNGDLILGRLEVAVQDQKYAAIRKRVIQAINLRRDLPKATATSILDRFKRDANQISLPKLRELQAALGKSKSVFSVDSARILDELARMVELAEHDDIRARVKRAIGLEKDFVNETVKFILGEFKADENRIKLPSQSELSKALDHTKSVFSKHYEAILEQLEKEVRNKEHESIRARITQAIGFYKDPAKEAAKYIIQLFISNRDQVTLPKLWGLTGVLGLSQYTFSYLYRGNLIFKYLAEAVDQSSDKDFKDRLTRALEKRKTGTQSSVSAPDNMSKPTEPLPTPGDVPVIIVASNIQAPSETRKKLMDTRSALLHTKYKLRNFKRFKRQVMTAFKKNEINQEELQSHLAFILSLTLGLFTQTKKGADFAGEVKRELEKNGKTVDVDRLLLSILKAQEVYTPYAVLNPHAVRHQMSSLIRDNHLLHSVLRLIGKDQQGKDMLSVGAGLAYLESDLAIKYAINLTAVDVVPQLLDGVKKANGENGPIETVLAHGELLPFFNQSYDSVIYPESLGHLNLDKALEEAFRVLKPGGQIYIMTYNPEASLLPIFEYEQPDESALKSALESRGFNSVNIHHFHNNNYWVISATKVNDRRMEEDEARNRSEARQIEWDLFKDVPDEIVNGLSVLERKIYGVVLEHYASKDLTLNKLFEIVTGRKDAYVNTKFKGALSDLQLRLEQKRSGFDDLWGVVGPKATIRPKWFNSAFIDEWKSQASKDLFLVELLRGHYGLDTPRVSAQNAGWRLIELGILHSQFPDVHPHYHQELLEQFTKKESSLLTQSRKLLKDFLKKGTFSVEQLSPLFPAEYINKVEAFSALVVGKETTVADVGTAAEPVWEWIDNSGKPAQINALRQHFSEIYQAKLKDVTSFRSEIREQKNPPVVLIKKAILRLDVNGEAFDPLTGDSQLIFDRVSNQVKTLAGKAINFGGKRSFEDYQLPLSKLYAPATEVIQLPTSNLGYNPYYAGYAKGRAYRYSLDPRDYQYEMLVTGKDGQMRKQAVRLQDGKGRAGIFDAQSGRDLSAEIDFGFYGPQILKNGTFNYGSAAEFDDLRHVLRLPIFVFDLEKGHYLGHEAMAGNQIHLGFSDGAGELFKNKELVRKASSGEVIQLSLKPLLTANTEQKREALSVEQIQNSFKDWGYKSVARAQDVSVLGDFYIDQNAQTILIKFLPGVHPHTAVGLTKTGELIVAGVSGETHFEGATLQSLAQAMHDKGAEDVWVWANGKDTRIISDQGNDLLNVTNARQDALALISIVPNRSEMRSSDVATALGEGWSAADVDQLIRDYQLGSIKALEFKDHKWKRIPILTTTTGKFGLKEITDWSKADKEVQSNFLAVAIHQLKEKGIKIPVEYRFSNPEAANLILKVSTGEQARYFWVEQWVENGKSVSRENANHEQLRELAKQLSRIHQASVDVKKENFPSLVRWHRKDQLAAMEISLANKRGQIIQKYAPHESELILWVLEHALPKVKSVIQKLPERLSNPDLNFGNVFLDLQGKISAVIDWESLRFGYFIEDFVALLFRHGGPKGGLHLKHLESDLIQILSAYQLASGNSKLSDEEIDILPWFFLVDFLGWFFREGDGEILGVDANRWIDQAKLDLILNSIKEIKSQFAPYLDGRLRLSDVVRSETRSSGSGQVREERPQTHASDEVPFQEWLEAQMAADTVNEVRLVQQARQVSPEAKALWQQSLVRWKDAIAVKEILKTAPVIFYTQEIEAQLIEFIELTQKSFELAYLEDNTKRYQFSVVFRTDYELKAFEKKYGKLKQVETYGPHAHGQLTTEVFNAKKWKNHYGVFGARELVADIAGLEWPRNLSAEGLSDEISFVLVPDAMRYLARTTTENINVKTLAQGLGNWFSFLQIQKGVGITILKNFLSAFVAGFKAVSTSV